MSEMHPKNEANGIEQSLSLEKLRSGDRQEFARLVEAYSGVIYRLALKIVGNPQDAEDVLQEAFIKALRYLPGFDGRSKISTWLYRIATNEALMMLRRRRPVFSIDDPEQENDDAPLQEPREIVDWCCLPEREMMSTEARQHIDQAIDGLSSSLKVVFLLREMEGLSTQETAEVLGLSETAVKTRLSRARLQMREQLSQYYGERMAKGVS